MNKLIPVEYKNERILTTAQLANNYETDAKRITDNYSANKSRYAAGVHYFKLEGDELRAFKHETRNSGVLENPDRISALYLWTEKGALLHAKSLNTDKAWEVYEKLVDTYFRAKEYSESIPENGPERIRIQAQADRSKAMLINAQSRMLKTVMGAIPVEKLSSVAVEAFAIKSIEVVTGIDMSQYLPECEKTFSATEIGKQLGGISSNKVGSLANKHGLKTGEYGITVMDKSPYSSKEMPSFRYFANVIPVLRKILDESV